MSETVLRPAGLLDRNLYVPQLLNAPPRQDENKPRRTQKRKPPAFRRAAICANFIHHRSA